MVFVTAENPLLGMPENGLVFSMNESIYERACSDGGFQRSAQGYRACDPQTRNYTVDGTDQNLVACSNPNFYLRFVDDYEILVDSASTS